MSFSGIGIGLSVIFGFLLLALIAQLYYLLWRKRRRTHAEIGSDESNYTKRMLDGACWKTLSSLQTTARGPETKILENDLESGVAAAATNKDVVLKSLGEESVESELMRLHNLAGPPRFLFTIKEETKEDLESEDGKSRKGSRTRSLSDLMVAIDTPFLPPLPSSPLKSSLNNPLDSYKNQGFNPLFESLSEPEINKFRSSSPPPKFKFLRDAEEKLYRRMIEEAHRRAQNNLGSVSESGVKDSPNPTTAIDERDGSFLRLIKNRERDQREVQQHQVLPLASSPTTFRPLEKESMVR